MVADLFIHQPVLIFWTTALAIVPLAGLIGESTEQLAIRLGPGAGGLLNASLGNLTELIVAVLLVQAGEFAVVKATLIGSIVGNLLFVLGVSFIVGGIRHKEQSFSRQAVGVHSASLFLAVAGLLIPALLFLTTPKADFAAKEGVSVGVALVLIALYLAALVFISLAMGRPMDFIFTGFEVAIVALATFIFTVISVDGRSNWLEGAQLAGLYVVVAVAAFFVVAT